MDNKNELYPNLVKALQEASYGTTKPNKKIQALKDLYNSAQTFFQPFHNTRFVEGTGDPNAPLVLVGEAPGKEEDTQQKPFVGRSGKLLRNILLEEGRPAEQVFITNVVKYRPPENRTPTQQEIEEWRNYLLIKELAIIAPRVICLVGKTPQKALTVKNTIERGTYPLLINNHEVIIIGTYHPAYVLRKQTAIKELRSAIALAIHLSK